MGMAIENSNALVKVYNEQHEAIGRVMKQMPMRVSQIVDMQYSLSYLIASSMGGCSIS